MKGVEWKLNRDIKLLFCSIKGRQKFLQRYLHTTFPVSNQDIRKQFTKYNEQVQKTNATQVNDETAWQR